MSKGDRGPRTAVEVMAELERHRVEDPEYGRKLEAAERERVEAARYLREVERPLLADLAGIGLELESVWDL